MTIRKIKIKPGETIIVCTTDGHPQAKIVIDCRPSVEAIFICDCVGADYSVQHEDSSHPAFFHPAVDEIIYEKW